MKTTAAALCAGALVALTTVMGVAQERVADPRVNLKPGFRDAGEASHNMEIVSSLSKPDGFFDPSQPLGAPTPPEQPEPQQGQQPAAPEQPAPPTAPPNNALNFATSDIAFKDNFAFVGSFHGFNVYNIEGQGRPFLMSSVVCPGGQGDVSVHGNLLIMSVEQTRGRVDCGLQGVQGAVSTERFRGIRIFDISNVNRPRQIAVVQTCRGSHTHTLVVDPDDRQNIYVYGSGTGAVRSAEELAECSGKDPKEDPNTALFSIDVVQIPLAAPEKARIVNRPRVFADPVTGAISGLWQGGNHGEGTQTSRVTRQCHDITVFPALGLAAGACAGNGILLDISDPVRPVRIDQVVDKSFAYWHSATFNNDGTKVIFTDEWGGGTRPRCRATDPATWGANAVFDIVDRRLRFSGYYKLPAAQTDLENCVAHNGSIIPVPGRDIMVQAWYQGGVSVFDFTDSSKPVEIAFFDRGPLDATQLITGGYWSTYWYNGFIYGTEIARGVDVFRLVPSEYLTKNEIDAATQAQLREFNAQQQGRITWPATPAVARAYVDQLTRSKAIAPAQAQAVNTALDRRDRTRLRTLAGQLEKDGASAAGRDRERFSALASTLRAL